MKKLECGQDKRLEDFIGMWLVCQSKYYSEREFLSLNLHNFLYAQMNNKGWIIEPLEGMEGLVSLLVQSIETSLPEQHILQLLWLQPLDQRKKPEVMVAFELHSCKKQREAMMR